MYKLGVTEKIIIYILSKGEWVSTGELVGILGKIARSEPAVRASLLRLRNKGIVTSRKRGKETDFTLARAGREWLSSYRTRVTRANLNWERKWLLVSFNIPEKKRGARNLFREWLKQAGFGRLNPSLWVSPYDLREECISEAERLKVRGHVSLFMTDYIGENPQELVNRAWNLGPLSRQYRKLVHQYKCKIEEFQEKDFRDESEAAMEALMRILEFKEEGAELIERDPMLPAELLPPGWVGFELREVLENYLDILYRKASALVEYSYLVNRKVGDES